MGSILSHGHPWWFEGHSQFHKPPAGFVMSRPEMISSYASLRIEVGLFTGNKWGCNCANGKWLGKKRGIRQLLMGKARRVQATKVGQRRTMVCLQPPIEIVKDPSVGVWFNKHVQVSRRAEWWTVLLDVGLLFQDFMLNIYTAENSSYCSSQVNLHVGLAANRTKRESRPRQKNRGKNGPVIGD